MKDLFNSLFKSEKKFLEKYNIHTATISNTRKTLMVNDKYRNVTYLNILKVVAAKEKEIKFQTECIEKLKESIKNRLWI